MITDLPVRSAMSSVIVLMGYFKDGDALGEESVIKDDTTIHSNRALNEGIITIAGNANGSTHAM